MLNLATTIMTSANSRQEVKTRNREIVTATKREKRGREYKREIQRKEAVDEETTTSLVVGRKYYCKKVLAFLF
jgi:hypothetical protein